MYAPPPVSPPVDVYKRQTQCNPELVQSIIEKEYQRIGLFPNASVDYYSTEYVAKELQQEEQDTKDVYKR